MRLEEYINENAVYELNESVFQNMLSKIKNKKSNVLEKLFKSSWIKLVKLIRDQDVEKDAIKIFNKQFNLNIRNLDQLTKERIKESIVMNESWKHWWMMVKDEGFPTLSFYPGLTAWLELDKLFDPDMAVNWSKFGVYAIFWIILISGKYLKGWEQWKKENPEEYEAEKKPKKKKSYRDKEQSAFVKAIGTQAIKRKLGK